VSLVEGSFAKGGRSGLDPSRGEFVQKGAGGCFPTSLIVKMTDTNLADLLRQLVIVGSKVAFFSSASGGEPIVELPKRLAGEGNMPVTGGGIGRTVGLDDKLAVNLKAGVAPVIGVVVGDSVCLALVLVVVLEEPDDTVNVRLVEVKLFHFLDGLVIVHSPCGDDKRLAFLPDPSQLRILLLEFGFFLLELIGLSEVGVLLYVRQLLLHLQDFVLHLELHDLQTQAGDILLPSVVPGWFGSSVEIPLQRLDPLLIVTYLFVHLSKTGVIGKGDEMEEVRWRR